MSEESIAELAYGGNEGGGRYGRFPHRPGPAELPPVTAAFDRALSAEVFRLRDRVHALETQILADKLRLPVPPWQRSEIPPASEEYVTFSGELRGPDYGDVLGDILKLLQDILRQLPPPNPGEIPPFT